VLTTERICGGGKHRSLWPDSKLPELACDARARILRAQNQYTTESEPDRSQGESERYD